MQSGTFLIPHNSSRWQNLFWTSTSRLLCLSSTDVDVDKPDEKSIMTYVAQFLKYHPGQKDSDSEDQLIEQVAMFFSAMIFLSFCFLRLPRFCLFVSVRMCLYHSQQIRPQQIIYTLMLLVIADQVHPLITTVSRYHSPASTSHENIFPLKTTNTT